ncbi:ABC transporter substrate-binding protein [Halonatronum saccharophilum]|uniref:ABC transporter substrate-binding protein n=1 Tax=Halonatronum saccharophilum TaxID=150060 RepID=UPI000489E658|nr:ABC transporter substrate-binding protein [Halonatronum saccharophilum]
MFKRKGFLMSIALVLMLVILVGCGGQEEVKEESQIAEDQRYGGTYMGRLSSDPPTLDPAHATDTTSTKAIDNIFDGLVRYDEDLNVVPAIAKDWDISDDSLTWTFYLRDNVYFHDGNHLTADDVVYSFSRILDPKTQSPRAWLFDRVEGAEAFQNGEADAVSGLKALDDYTVEITLAEPFTPFLSVLTMEVASIVSPEAAKEYGDDFTRNPIGAGPFEFVSWRNDHQLELVKNENYYIDGLPYLDEVVFRIISESSPAFAEYEQGNIYEMADGDIPDGQMQRVLTSDEFSEELINVPTLGTYYFGFNTEVEPFNDKKVRQAMNFAINRDIIADVLMNGTVTPARGILPPGMPGYNDEIEGYNFDVDRAKELLAEAGYPDGLPGTYELAYNTDDTHQSIAEALQRNLKSIGVDVELINMEWGTYIEKVDDGDTEMFRLGWIAAYADADYFLHPLFHSSNAGPGGNGAFYSNSEIDEMLDKARGMEPGEDRVELYQEAERIIVDDAPWIPVYHYARVGLVKPFVNNYFMGATGEFPLTEVWLDPDHQ